ncbi:zinc finger (CCCH type) protein, putative [Eimeria mitis]|uniref:Zinc finger (CCCH type) protein, putative n=1 Tax=Eimeria mitis TaxID=44415 RepID=U6KI24_9EIME|nr:zinc finger (CCCH type) protein, putative [Eimeria mitis]CDJ36436.1 zinc finger (CCCH type) protein, putative [Eimeria mitis]
MCRSWLSGNCLKNDRCTHAHGEVELLLYRHRALQLGRRDFFDEREAARGANTQRWSSRQTQKGFLTSSATGERARGGSNAHKTQQQQQQLLLQCSSAGVEGAPLGGGAPRGAVPGARTRQSNRNNSKRNQQQQQQQQEKLPVTSATTPQGAAAETAILLQLAAQLQALAVSQQSRGEGAP